MHRRKNGMILFGFTFEVYEFLKKLKSKNKKIEGGVDLIHGGGWKSYTARV